MPDPARPARVVRPLAPVAPPGSTPLRELLGAASEALSLPAGLRAEPSYEYLRICRYRGRIALASIRRLLASRELGNEELLVETCIIRDYLRDRPFPGPEDTLADPAQEPGAELLP
jgi:hypothetical protein